MEERGLQCKLEPDGSDRAEHHGQTCHSMGIGSN